MYFTPIRRLLGGAPLIFVCAALAWLHSANSAPAPELNAAENTWTDRVAQGEESSRRPLTKPWEDARQIWNGLRTVQKHYAARERRNAPTPTAEPVPVDHSELNSLSIPAYMKELYLNMSQQDSKDVDTTTIRSLPALNTSESESATLRLRKVGWF